MRVAVLGAGPAGLYAAWMLARRGVEVAVLDKEPEPGGLCRTVCRDGYRFDLGGHRFLTDSPSILSDVSSLLGGDLLVRRRKSLIDLRGTLLRYPPSWREIARRLPKAFVARAAASFLAARVAGRRPAATLEEWLEAGYGRFLYRELFRGYSEKLWGIPPSAIAADWAPERIAVPGLWRMLREAASRNGRVRSFAVEYRYPRLGIGQIFTAMADRVRELGGRVLTQRRVEAFETSGGSVRAVLCAGPHGAERIEADRVITTVPPPDFARAAGLPAPPLAFRGLLFLDLVVRADAAGDATWIYLPDPGVPATRLQKPASRSEAMVPPGGASLMLEIPFSPGDEVDRLPRDVLAARCIRRLESTGWIEPGAVLGFFFRREEHAYPVYRVGYEAARSAYLRAVLARRNVLPAGRQGLFRYLFMDRAMESGRHAARAVLCEVPWGPWNGGNFSAPGEQVR